MDKGSRAGLIIPQRRTNLRAVNPSIHRAIYDQFLDKFSRARVAPESGDGSGVDVQIGQLIDRRR